MIEPAPRQRRAFELAVVLGLGVVILVIDQVSKALVAANLALGQRANVVGDVLQVWHAENSGAAFSLFQNGLPLFLVVTVIALGMVVYFVRALSGRSLWFFLILGLVLGGTLGNLTDRLAHHGLVVDFISFGIGETRFPTFNVADSALVVGIFALVVALTFFDEPGGAASDANRASPKVRPSSGSDGGPAAGPAG